MTLRSAFERPPPLPRPTPNAGAVPVFRHRLGCQLEAWSTYNPLINTVHASDHLESMLFLTDYSVNYDCFDTAED
eukprot:COSAG02_NODE_87_length_38906_cov_69.688697_12_plen_75_part_00